ncbi:MAG: cell wall-active antibiotics response protein LiaF, partial [Atopostipes sp.]|nr:cell wall-active antibiotics response protein LiaF [Atopostipes sp.]
IGNTTFDLGKTLLPREENIILIRQAIGKVKILIPEETAVSVDFSVSIGRIILDSTEYSLVNENFTWHSTNYYSRDRKIKIVSNLLIGELEVIFL